MKYLKRLLTVTLATITIVSSIPNNTLQVYATEDVVVEASEDEVVEACDQENTDVILADEYTDEYETEEITTGEVIAEENSEIISDNNLSDDGQIKRVTITLDDAFQFGGFEATNEEDITVVQGDEEVPSLGAARNAEEKLYQGMLAYDAYIDISSFKISEDSIKTLVTTTLNNHSDLYYVGKTLNYEVRCGIVLGIS